jgi:hypothetical protein
MSTDLTLLVLRGPRALSETLVSDVDRLQLDTDSRIPDQDVLVDAHQIPPQLRVLYVYGGELDAAEYTREDHYGAALTFVYAGQLRTLKVPDNASPRNKAIKAFVDALPDDTPIILMWH